MTAQDVIHLRNLVAHGMIAEKLLIDPTLLFIAADTLSRWIAEQGESAALLDWRRLFDEGDQRKIVATLLRVDDEGMRLRSSSPFSGILTDQERALVYDGVRKRDA